jgi:hypothetical protein
LGEPHVFSQEVDKHALPTSITNQGRSNFQSGFCMLHRTIANATQVLLCKFQWVEVGEHEKQTKQHPHTLGPLHTQPKSYDHESVRALKKVSKGCPKTPPKSCSVVTNPQI